MACSMLQQDAPASIRTHVSSPLISTALPLLPLRKGQTVVRPAISLLSV
jgi:hypothetical protein